MFVSENKVLEVKKYLGFGTSHLAELFAIEQALDDVCELPLVLYTDSQMALEMLFFGGRPRANIDVISRIIGKIEYRRAAGHSLTAEWVRGHNGNLLHDRADFLAADAAKTRQSSITEIY